MNDDIRELVKKLFEFEAQETIDLEEKNTIIDQLIILDIKQEDILHMPYSSYEEISGYEERIDHNQRLFTLILYLSGKISYSDEIIKYIKDIKREILISINKIIFLAQARAKNINDSDMHEYVNILDFINRLEFLFNRCNMGHIISQIDKRLLNDLIESITKYIMPILRKDFASYELNIDRVAFRLLSLIAKTHNSMINSNILNEIILCIKDNKEFLNVFSYLEKYCITARFIHKDVYLYLNKYRIIKDNIIFSNIDYFETYRCINPELLELMIKLVNLNSKKEKFLEKIRDETRGSIEKRFIIFEILIPKMGSEEFLRQYLLDIKSEGINIKMFCKIFCRIKNQDYIYCKRIIYNIFKSLSLKWDKTTFASELFLAIIMNKNLESSSKFGILNEIYKLIIENMDLDISCKLNSQDYNWHIRRINKLILIIKLIKNINETEISDELKVKFLDDIRHNIEHFMISIKSEQDKILKEISELESILSVKLNKNETYIKGFMSDVKHLFIRVGRSSSDISFNENKQNVSGNPLIEAPITPKISRDNEKSLEK